MTIPQHSPDLHTHRDEHLSRVWRAIIIVSSITALIWMLSARIFGPSDLWDQTQPKTVSYTTDIVVNGRWILPVERGQFPATKPPLYNWLAAPAVWLLGFASEPAHKLPSVIALCLSWLILVRLGRRFDQTGHGSLGYLAGMIFVSCYTIFKLGYLARPDMLLSLWILLGWLAATALFVDAARDPPQPFGRPRLVLAACFWLSVAMAGLTKGPALIVLPMYATLFGWIISRRWRAVGLLGWSWGVPLVLILLGAWVWAVWLIDPDHLRRELWYNEIFGRVTGTGPEGSRQGALGWVKGLPYMPLYYLVRFVPWSLLSILAMISLHRRQRPGGQPSWRTIGPAGQWLIAASLMVLVIVSLFTLSAGKRADYIAGAFAPGAILAAWWLTQMKPYLGLRLPWLAPVTAASCLLVMTIINQRQDFRRPPGFGDQIMQFAHDALPIIESRRAPLAFWNAGGSHLQAMLGASTIDGSSPLKDRIAQHQPFWVVAGTRTKPPRTFQQWVTRIDQSLIVYAVLESPHLARTEDWPEFVTLYRVEPANITDFIPTQSVPTPQQ